MILFEIMVFLFTFYMKNNLFYPQTIISMLITFQKYNHICELNFTFLHWGDSWRHLYTILINIEKTLVFEIFLQNSVHFFTCKTLKSLINQAFQTNCGGEEGIRTLAPVAQTNGLANRPLRPTWVLLH